MSTININKRLVSHHFASADQEFSSSKVGMWLFLLTEILLFSVLFLTYVIYRTWYPEMFDMAASRLSWQLGAVNTCFLIFSSFTMALSIRFAQQDKPKKTVYFLWATIFFACAFLLVKYVEYSSKFEHGIFPGGLFVFPGEHLSNESLYFSIYYLMTGTHVLHVIIGIGLIFWVTIKSSRGDFYHGYYTPLEMVGLYWHLVDLIWIFLFPLLYLTK